MELINQRNMSGILRQLVMSFILIQLLVCWEFLDFVGCFLTCLTNRIAYSQGGSAGNLSIKLNYITLCLKGLLDFALVSCT